MGRLVASLLILLLPLAGATAWEADEADDVAPPGVVAPWVDILNATLVLDETGLRMTMALNGTIRDAPDNATLTYLWVFTLDDQGRTLYEDNDGTVICTVAGTIRCNESQDRGIIFEAGENGTHVWAVMSMLPETPSSDWRIAAGASQQQRGALTAQDFTKSAIPGGQAPGTNLGDEGATSHGDNPSNIWTYLAVGMLLALGAGVVYILRR